ncbi:AraC family transcriptional regulator [Paenibacillus sp. LMG 31457]|uniref:AraC family transcriptional regulator n=1 Tax=Paenibacillus planticolens TaxID=2654976 RepID=A0ABX1ZIK7_9BACL|nr:AraC family transcriptional regulator [Paenibacillus planticolens]
MNLADIANELFVTPNYLSRLFRQETGQSFSDYLSRMRIKDVETRGISMNLDFCRAVVVDDEVWVREGIQNYLDWSSLNALLNITQTNMLTGVIGI